MENFSKIRLLLFVISVIQVSRSNERATQLAALSFDAIEEAMALSTAINHTEPHKRVIIDLLARRGIEERLQIAKAYMTNYRRDLVADLESVFSGNSRNVLVAMMIPVCDYLAEEFEKALWGSSGVDEDTIIELLCTLDNCQIRAVARAYERLSGESIPNTRYYSTCLVLLAEAAECVKGKTLRYAFGYNSTWGRFKKLGISLIEGTREGGVDEGKVSDDAWDLFTAGVAKCSVRKGVFYTILTTRSYRQLRDIFVAYRLISNRGIEQTIKSKFRGTPKKLLLGLVACANCRSEFFAKVLFHSMERFGRNDRNLIRIIVTRSEIDLGDIAEKFTELYGITLESFIEKKTVDYYQYALRSLIHWTPSFRKNTRIGTGHGNCRE